MATISNNNIARAIYLASKEKKGSEQAVFLKDVVGFLSRRRLISKSKNILSALSRIVNQAEGVLEVNVWSKAKISEHDKKELIHFLKKRYGDQKFILQEHLDEKLLGGLKIKIQDEMIDLSLQSKIYKLQEHLIKSHE